MGQVVEAKVTVVSNTGIMDIIYVPFLEVIIEFSGNSIGSGCSNLARFIEEVYHKKGRFTPLDIAPLQLRFVRDEGPNWGMP